MKDEEKKEHPFIPFIRSLADEILSQKGFNIKAMSLLDPSAICRHLVISEVFIDHHLKAVAEHLVLFLKKQGNRPRVEGKSAWVLLDCGQVIVHLLTSEARAYYSIETLWGDQVEEVPLF